MVEPFFLGVSAGEMWGSLAVAELDYGLLIVLWKNRDFLFV